MVTPRRLRGTWRGGRGRCVCHAHLPSVLTPYCQYPVTRPAYLPLASAWDGQRPYPGVVCSWRMQTPTSASSADAASPAIATPRMLCHFTSAAACLPHHHHTTFCALRPLLPSFATANAFDNRLSTPPGCGPHPTACYTHHTAPYVSFLLRAFNFRGTAACRPSGFMPRTYRVPHTANLPGTLASFCTGFTTCGVRRAADDSAGRRRLFASRIHPALYLHRVPSTPRRHALVYLPTPDLAQRSPSAALRDARRAGSSWLRRWTLV